MGSCYGPNDSCPESKFGPLVPTRFPKLGSTYSGRSWSPVLGLKLGSWFLEECYHPTGKFAHVDIYLGHEVVDRGETRERLEKRWGGVI